MQELFQNPSHYLLSDTKFVVLVSDAQAVNDDSVDDAPIILHKIIGFNGMTRPQRMLKSL